MVYFTYFEISIVYKTLLGRVMCLKRLITVLFKSSEQFHLLRLMDAVGFFAKNILKM